jgi:predicted GNAT superfamily acetyltransferase
VEQLRDTVESDFPAILMLNEVEARQTSQMDLGRLQSLVRMSAYSKVVTIDGQVAAFLIALRDGAPYANDNYAWFAARMPCLLYVDRVVVAAQFSGRRIGSRLYEDLFAFARAQRIGTITCEYNIDPPNPASRAFHDKFGFKELGTQWVAGGTKQVSLQAAEIQQLL